MKPLSPQNHKPETETKSYINIYKQMLLFISMENVLHNTLTTYHIA